MVFELPELPYEMNSLEPYISKETLEYHYGILYRSYLANLNTLVNGTKFKNLDLQTIIKIADGPIFNNTALFWSHTFYFEGLKPSDNGTLTSSFTNIIKSAFGSAEFFKKAFIRAADSLLGSGWVWLVLNEKGSLQIMAKSNAGNPLRLGFVPILACDVWEHAYYLDYRNRFDDYIGAFWNLINWAVVEKRYSDAI
jgi:superoxide dismutase, Fe-Mn family